MKGIHSSYKLNMKLEDKVCGAFCFFFSQTPQFPLDAFGITKCFLIHSQIKDDLDLVEIKVFHHSQSVFIREKASIPPFV